MSAGEMDEAEAFDGFFAQSHEEAAAWGLSPSLQIPP
jgi:hypothetical protein